MNVSDEENVSNFTSGKIMHSEAINTAASVIGWMYFAAWTLSFYPQVYTNWRRKSVIGLSFDFVVFNITGFVAYSCYNVGLFWIPTVREEYFLDHPDGINPVQVNDVFFALHAMTITFVVIIQCFIFEKGTQKVTKWCKGTMALIVLFIGTTLVVSITETITWLTFLQMFSYIKLVVTVLKYVPQAYLNFRRKSTIGWSIGNVLCDFTGGWLSILQMFLLAYNGDDWASIFGNVTKFALGVVTIFFDSLFIIQHYLLYRGKGSYEVIKDVEIMVSNSGEQGSDDVNKSERDLIGGWNSKPVKRSS
uniref:Cystinosin homolog n=1 Tax=Arion vulgaris TaxID=1028688 RepID=A0A0B6ZNS1_9EUPU